MVVFEVIVLVAAPLAVPVGLVEVAPDPVGLSVVAILLTVVVLRAVPVLFAFPVERPAVKPVDFFD